MLQRAPQANRLQIAVFGRRNVGKSSLVNAMTGQPVSLVSEIAGTTTDPVYKSMEILPIGPVMWIDTAGLDDSGEIGELRVQKTRKVMDRTDLALLVFSPTASDDDTEWNWEMELNWYEELRRRQIPTIGVINRIDEGDVDASPWEKRFPIPFVKVSALTGANLDRLVQAIQKYGASELETPTLASDLVPPSGLVVLVAPPDLQSPKGRLKLAQVQVIRDLLDHHVMCLTVTDHELVSALQGFGRDPDLVITDATVFDAVSKMVPERVPLTSFSMVMARQRGDLTSLIKGASVIEKLRPGDRVLIAEACTHHALKGDMAREQLPGWLEQKAGGPLDVTLCTGNGFPEDLTEYRLVVHCGACMFNRRQLMSRIQTANQQGIPITNFGVAIAQLQGKLKRAAKVFLDAVPDNVPQPVASDFV